MLPGRLLWETDKDQYVSMQRSPSLMLCLTNKWLEPVAEFVVACISADYNDISALPLLAVEERLSILSAM